MMHDGPNRGHIARTPLRGRRWRTNLVHARAHACPQGKRHMAAGHCVAARRAASAASRRKLQHCTPCAHAQRIGAVTVHSNRGLTDTCL